MAIRYRDGGEIVVPVALDVVTFCRLRAVADEAGVPFAVIAAAIIGDVLDDDAAAHQREVLK